MSAFYWPTVAGRRQRALASAALPAISGRLAHWVALLGVGAALAVYLTSRLVDSAVVEFLLSGTLVGVSVSLLGGWRARSVLESGLVAGLVGSALAVCLLVQG